MPNIALHYLGFEVGRALVDPELARLSSTYLWSLDLPESVRGQHRGRPDILLALLREDPTSLAKCAPFTQIRVDGLCVLTLRLSHLAMRPQLVSVLNTLHISSIPQALATLRGELSSIRRVIHLDLNRCNCQSSNLREISYASVGSVPSPSVFF